MLFDTAERAWEQGPHARNAIVTVVIGADYLKVWKALCEANWRAYADAFGYDVFVISDFIDKSDASRARSPAWQKLLILDQPWAQRYERIVWLDADIVISEAALDILASATAPEKVGICEVGAQMSPAEKHLYCEHVFKRRIIPQEADEVWRTHVSGQYRGSGVVSAGGPMLSTGVMVLSPRHHQALLREIYQRPQASTLYEQAYLSRALLDAGLHQLISPRFNWGVHEVLLVTFAPDHNVQIPTLQHHLRNQLRNAYFLHFAGSFQVMKMLAEAPGQFGSAAAD